MEALGVIISILVVISLIAAIAQQLGGGNSLEAINKQVTEPGRLLAQKFRSLGNMTGKTRAEIERVVGAPNSISAMGDGNVMCQWLVAGYHIAIAFEPNGKFIGIQHEFSQL
ncbi:MAG TPA: hypothetical protein VNA19_17095 [Pyrinomonadaceae bacterium]|jgi:hypothetical protein|nr:hypothetical protein [Pyrinomonadaceae bacterium]